MRLQSEFLSSDLTMAAARYNYSEENFLFKCLQEVVLVWRNGSGQASIKVNVNNGETDVQLGF